MTAREVELTGGSPWGFRMHGGSDVNQPLRISRVNPGRKAALSGIREGDVISSINSIPTRNMTNADAHAMLKNSGEVLKLGLNEDSTGSPRRRSSTKSNGLDLKRPSQLLAEMKTTKTTVSSPLTPNNIHSLQKSTKHPETIPSPRIITPAQISPSKDSTPFYNLENKPIASVPITSPSIKPRKSPAENDYSSTSSTKFLESSTTQLKLSPFSDEVSMLTSLSRPPIPAVRTSPFKSDNNVIKPVVQPVISLPTIIPPNISSTYNTSPRLGGQNGISDEYYSGPFAPVKSSNASIYATPNKPPLSDDHNSFKTGSSPLGSTGIISPMPVSKFSPRSPLASMPFIPIQTEANVSSSHYLPISSQYSPYYSSKVSPNAKTSPFSAIGSPSVINSNAYINSSNATHSLPYTTTTSPAITRSSPFSSNYLPITKQSSPFSPANVPVTTQSSPFSGSYIPTSTSSPYFPINNQPSPFASLNYSSSSQQPFSMSTQNLTTTTSHQPSSLSTTQFPAYLYNSTVCNSTDLPPTKFKSTNPFITEEYLMSKTEISEHKLTETKEITTTQKISLNGFEPMPSKPPESQKPDTTSSNTNFAEGIPTDSGLPQYSEDPFARSPRSPRPTQTYYPETDFNAKSPEDAHLTAEAPGKLKDLCLTRVASLPYGSAILQELAAVSESLGNITSQMRPNCVKIKQQETMASSSDVGVKRSQVIEIHAKPPTPVPEKVPPPIAPRQSSFRLSREEPPRVGLRSRVNPSVVALLTPSQKVEIERKWDTAADEAGELIDMHKKYVERRGYREYHSDSESKAPWANNIRDKVSVQSPVMRRRVSGTAGTGAADANRPLASVRDREAAFNVTRNADDVRNPMSDRLRFAETVRAFEDLNENVLDGEKRTFWTKKLDDGNISVDISESLRSDSRMSARIKNGNIDDTDFGLKSLEALIEGLDSKVQPKPMMNGNGESNKSKERIIKIYQNNSDSEDSKSHVQRLHNRRAFILDDPIFDPPKTDNKVKKIYPLIDSGEPRRRRSLPRDIQDRQMEYIIQKEREIEEQIKSLEREKWLSNYETIKTSEVKIDASSNKIPEKSFSAEQYHISRQGDVAIQSEETADKISKQIKIERPLSQAPLLCEPSQGEKFRDQMYSEYMDRVAEREERKQHKVIKMTSVNTVNGTEAVSVSKAGTLEEIKKACGMIEEEFITKAKERWDKLGFGSFDEDIKNPSPKPGDPACESRPVIIDHKIKVLDGDKEKDVKKLPSHLREFVQFTASGGGQDAGEFKETKKDRDPSVFVTVCALLVLLFTIGRSFWIDRE